MKRAIQEYINIYSYVYVLCVCVLRATRKGRDPLLDLLPHKTWRVLKFHLLFPLTFARAVRIPIKCLKLHLHTIYRMCYSEEFQLILTHGAMALKQLIMLLFTLY